MDIVNLKMAIIVLHVFANKYCNVQVKMEKEVDNFSHDLL